MQIRHGDVQLTQIAGVPAGFKAEDKPGDIILAEGEHTGHAHRIKLPGKPGRNRSAVLLRKAGEDFAILQVRRLVALTHEEHDRVEIAPGFYRVGIKRQYDEDTQGWSNVAD
jgi:hypothetical protein